MTKTEFYEKYYPLVVKLTNGTPLFPEVVISQMAIESSYGDSSNAKTCNNYFGIKKGSWQGEICTLKTSKDAKKVSEFRKYASAENSIKDYIQVLLTNKRYAKAINAKSKELQAQYISEAGYAENRQYLDLILKVMAGIPLKFKNYVQENPKKSVLGFVVITTATYLLYKKRKNIKKILKGK